MVAIFTQVMLSGFSPIWQPGLQPWDKNLNGFLEFHGKMIRRNSNCSVQNKHRRGPEMFCFLWRSWSLSIGGDPIEILILFIPWCQQKKHHCLFKSTHLPCNNIFLNHSWRGRWSKELNPQLCDSEKLKLGRAMRDYSKFKTVTGWVLCAPQC